jgi:opacity protein-like surface antigen
MNTAIIAQLFLTLQAGFGTVGGSGTETNIDKDCNPGWPWQILDDGSMPRIAIGARRENLGLELGYGSLPRYTRRIDLTVGQDVANENVKAKVIDLRGVYYFRDHGRLMPYAFGILAVVNYERNWWTGHKTINGEAMRVVARASDAWKKEDGTALGYGGGIGAEYRITKNWSATAEASALLGEFHVYSGRLGIRYDF